MRNWLALAGAMVLFGPIAASADPPPPKSALDAAAPAPIAALPPDTVVIKKGPGDGTRPFGFTHVVFHLPDGAQWMSQRGGWMCIPAGTRTWTGGQVQERINSYMDVLRPKMQSAGFSVDGDPDNVFAPSTSTADLQLAAIVTNLHLDFCQQFAGTTPTTVTGTATMEVEWQVYSTIQKTIVAKISTEGDFKADAAAHATLNSLLQGAFATNVDQLIDSDAFHKALAGAPTDAAGLVKPQGLTPISLPGASTAKARSVGDTVGSVVMLFAGQSQGSAFLISSDGLLLTDQHVVGDAKYVKVRWPDGIEGLGEVVRADKVRDVALVKTDPRGRLPIRIRREPLQPGDAVFAIGAPLDPKFQSTVTRGVLSAYRTFEGVNFIQSDVVVNPGSSGGPLLDEKGEAVGLTESGLQAAGAPIGINLFVPVGDALDFLGAEVQ